MGLKADAKEPSPVINSRPFVQDEVIADFFTSTETDRHVREDLEARKQYGIRKYGTALQAFNGRDATMDAYQEALDLVCYLRQCLDQGQLIMGEYLDAIEIVRSLRNRLDAQR